MHDGVHLRLIVSRGLKPTPYQAPWVISSKPTIVIIPEFKKANEKRSIDGIRLVSVDIRRSGQRFRILGLTVSPSITALRLASRQITKGEEGLMLDPHGFVSTCNSTHFFMVRDGVVWTSTGEYCLDGITRRKVLEICDSHGIPYTLGNFTFEDVHLADEAFVTGTFAGLTPVISFDGTVIGQGSRGGYAKGSNNCIKNS